MTVRSVSPQRPSDVVVEVAAADRETVRTAAETARRAQAEWLASPPVARSQALSAAADAVVGAAEELTALMVREVGKPLTESAGEVARSAAILRYYAQQVLDPDGETYPSPGEASLLMARRRPRGVVGLITPWNFPLAIPLWKAAPALAYGNGVLLKPAPESTAMAQRLGELIGSALPDGLLAVLPGEAETGEAVVDAADAVSFTGSVAAGQSVRLAAARRVIAVQCEMGGQNPSVVLPDADVEGAASTVAAAAMGYAGQKCTATSRAIVVGDPAPFTAALVAAVEALSVDDPDGKDVTVGPVITEDARAAVLQATAQVREDGGRVLAGGEQLDRDGWFVAPTLVDSVPAGHVTAQEEVFGPFCVVLPAEDVDAAVRLANGVRYGLTAAVFTRDLGAALSVSRRLAAGQIKVNAPTSGVDFYAPFGGEKDSSYGPREQGKAARDFYTSVQTITVLGG